MQDFFSCPVEPSFHLPWTINPFALWSLLDMLKVAAQEYIEIGETVREIGFNLYAGELDKEYALKPEEKAKFLRLLLKLKIHCEKIKLKTSSVLLEEAIKNLPENAQTLQFLLIAIKAELSQHLFLFVPPHRSNYYERSDFSQQFISSFPKASRELIRSGNCYAVGEYTACVFHSMRGTEIGVWALSTSLNVTSKYPLELTEWGRIIEDIDNKIQEKQPFAKRSLANSQEFQFLSEASLQFTYFKNAYRNPVAHARETYEEDKAESIMRQTIEFLQIISVKLKLSEAP